MLFMFVRALSYKQFIHVIARTVPLTFKLTKVKMHKTRWGNGLQARHYKGQDTARYICIESSLQIYHRVSPRKVDCYTANHDEICGF